jgi:hypothetical protein
MLAVFGNIANPYSAGGLNVTSYNVPNGGGLIVLLSNLSKLVVVIAGIYSLMNFILAGIGFMGAGGDPKVMQRSQERIYRSIMGLIVVAGSYLIAGIVGYLLFGQDNWDILIKPVIFTP